MLGCCLGIFLMPVQDCFFFYRLFVMARIHLGKCSGYGGEANARKWVF